MKDASEKHKRYKLPLKIKDFEKILPTKNEDAKTIVLLRRRKVPGSIVGDALGGIEWMNGKLSGAGLGGDTNGTATLWKRELKRSIKPCSHTMFFPQKTIIYY